MKLIIQTPQKAMKVFSKQKPLRSEIDNFKKHLISLLDKISIIEKRPTDESEEHLKNDLRDFLRDTYYLTSNAINTKDKKDLVIHLDKTTDSEVGVIIEAKRPTNINEMITADNPNKKALHELILYYLDERNIAGNYQMKQLVITNINQWYIIDANHFDKHIYNNSKIKNLYKTYKNDHKTNPWFYDEIAKIISTLTIEIPCVYFNIKEYDKVLRNKSKEDDKLLSPLFKTLSAQYLLKQATPNDSNSLNEKFYKEILHIIGLEEAKEGGKNVIRRKKENRSTASLIEVTMDSLQSNDPNYIRTAEGNTKEEQIFNVALELCITWMNRILFLKLMEGQLVNYHEGNKEYKFLDSKKIFDYDELFTLFHNVLALKIADRKEAVKEKYGKVPYLNSSLFDISPLERETIKISALDNRLQLDLISTTILKEQKKKSNTLPTLEYLFNFLDAYDFASEGTEDILDDKKELINASVLGKIFEKLNGYKDGSIFTPAFITMYMSKQSIRLAVVQKFNETLSTKEENKFDTFEDVKNYTSKQYKATDILALNKIINSLRICDPAVGSGHFLVSALNEIISIKAELGILADDKGNSINNYEIEIINDELKITEPKDNDNQFEYTIQNGKPKTKEIQRLQKTLFYEKQTIIENCLFGVDINPNSVKICSLRLWIELLKNAYYKEETNYLELETLPNIDINIKCGNSLLSRYTLNEDLSNTLKSIKYTFDDYKGFVSDYKNATDKEEKRGLLKIISDIKETITAKFFINSKENKSLARTRGEYDSLVFNRVNLWGDKMKGDKYEMEKKRLELLMERDEKKIEDIKNNVVYKNAFEWRFEFPEVLNHNGDFEGFDLIIGNPPYILISRIDYSSHFRISYKTFEQTGDIYLLFYELGFNLIKQNGSVNYITSNKWLKSNYGKKFRIYIKENTSPLQLIDFAGNKIFDNASVDTSIFSFAKSKTSLALTATSFPNMKEIENNFISIIENNQTILNSLNDTGWFINSDIKNQIMLKMEQKGTTIKNWDFDINMGLKSGFSEAFIIDEETKNDLILKDKKNIEIIKPLLRGKNIKKYNYEFNNQYLIHTHNGIKDKKIKPIDVINDFPTIYEFLKKFQPSLEKRQDKGNHWTNLRNCVYFDQLEHPKIIYPDIANGLNFMLDENGYYINNTAYFLTTGNRYLLAILNSKLASFYYNSITVQLGTSANRAFTIYIEQIPIPIINEKEQQPFIDLVDIIIMQKQQGIDSTSNEAKIDELVYKLYDLTEEEIKIIEN